MDNKQLEKAWNQDRQNFTKGLEEWEKNNYPIFAKRGEK